MAETSISIGVTSVVEHFGAVTGAQIAADPALSAAYPKFTAGRNPLTGLFHVADFPGATLAARTQAAVLACEAANGGTVYLQSGSLSAGETVTVLGAATDGWSVGRVELRGAGMGGTVITSAGGNPAFALGPANTTSGSTVTGNKINLVFRGFTLQGPGKATTDSVGVDSRTTGGSYLWDDVYVHGYDIGIRYHDQTLVSGYQLQVRECNIGVACGFASDAHKYVGSRIDYCGIALYLGYVDSARGQAANSNQSHAFSLDGIMCAFNQVGVYLVGNDTYGVSIRDSYFEQWTDAAVRVAPADGSSGFIGHALLDNCFFNGNTGSTVATYWGVASGKRTHSVEVNLAYSVTVRGCGFFGNTDAPIRLTQTSSCVRVEKGRFHQGSGELGDVKLPDGTYAWMSPAVGQHGGALVWGRHGSGDIAYASSLPTASVKWLGARLRLHSTDTEYRCESDGAGGYAWYALPSARTLGLLTAGIPGLPGVAPAVGEYAIPVNAGTSTSAGFTTSGRMILVPLDIAASGSYDTIGTNVTVVGTGAGQVIRMGLYANGANGRPTGSPLVDAGTVDPTAGTGNLTKTFTAVPLVPGRYWEAWVLQGTVTIAPTMVSLTLLASVPVTSLGNNGSRCWFQDGVSGALPAIGALSLQASPPIIGLKRSA